MKVRELFEKAALPKHTRFVLTKFEDLKSSLAGHGLTGLQIRACLNNAFAPLMIKFTLNPAPDHTSQYTEVGLDGGAYTSDGWVVINLTDVVADVLANKTKARYEDFSQLCTGYIVHELKHREQIMKHKANALNGKDPDRLRDYLSDHRETDAFVAQCLVELLSVFDPNTIFSKLQSKRGVDELMKFSEVLKIYDSVFHRPSSMMNRFFKKLHVAATHFNEQGLD